jgi:membrane peptidoglycan carboxypeptidase
MAEATLLAGIPQQPANLDLFTDFEAAKNRQRVVLDMMVRHGYLSQQESDAVHAEPIALNPDPDRRDVLVPQFVEYVEDVLDSRLGEGFGARSGMQITTTLDLRMQELAQKTVAKKVKELQPKHNLSNASLVALRPVQPGRPGAEVLAMVGSADYSNDKIQGQVNVARSLRQPGSSIKPVLYATALNDNLISPATVLWDIPVTYKIPGSRAYTPRNYDGKFHGPMTVRTALANSYNIPAVKLLDAVTVDRLIDGAELFGMRSLSEGRGRFGLALTLGGGEVTLLELTSAYASFASEGHQARPEPILKATDSLGRDVPGALLPPAADRRAVSPAAAFMVTDILSDNKARAPMFGANSPLKLTRPAAAKTGTTDDWRDNWTIGFTKYLTAGVWAGNTNGRPMSHVTGITGAAPIWHEFMEGVIADPAMLAVLGAPTEPEAWEFTPPPDVERRTACPPGVKCREGGEYFSKLWLETAGEAGPLADTTEVIRSAPVWVQGPAGARWSAYCRTDEGLARRTLKLPLRMGLPLGPQAERSDAAAKEEYLRAAAWTVRRVIPANLGDCGALPTIVQQALRTDPNRGDGGLRATASLNRAGDPAAGPLAAEVTKLDDAPVASASDAPPEGTPQPPDAVAEASAVSDALSYRYVVSQPVLSHSQCPGHYIVGSVHDLNGNPQSGVHLVLVDQWGNRADAVTKAAPSDFGRYDFPINSIPSTYTLQIVNDAGTAISPPIAIDHLRGEGGDLPCHTVVWGGE